MLQQIIDMEKVYVIQQIIAMENVDVLQQIIAMENGGIRQQGSMKEIKQKDNELYESWKTAVQNCRWVIILSTSLSVKWFLVLLEE